MINKRAGILGGTISMIFAVIAVVIILLIFALGSELVRWTEKTGISVIDECDVGLKDVYVHIERSGSLVETKHSLVGGKVLEEALAEHDARVLKIRNKCDKEEKEGSGVPSKFDPTEHMGGT